MIHVSRRAILAVLVFAVAAQATTGQESAAQPAAGDDSATALFRRAAIVRGGMVTLGSWAVANLAVGGVGWAVAEDPTLRGFAEMSALWNTVNLGLALGGLATAEETPSTLLPSYRESSGRLERVLLFNAGLDVGYMMLGAWLWDRGARGVGIESAAISSEQLTGWGQALVVQGAFLFVFDLVLARLVADDRERSAGW